MYTYMCCPKETALFLALGPILPTPASRSSSYELDDDDKSLKNL